MGGINTSFYNVPEVDQLLNQANEETDVAKRKSIFNQAEKKIVEDAPWLFISHAKQQVAIRKRVKGFELQPTYIYYFNNVSLGEDEGEGRGTRSSSSPLIPRPSPLVTRCVPTSSVASSTWCRCCSGSSPWCSWRCG